MAPTTARTNNNKCKPKKYNKPRRGTPTPFSSSALLVAAVYSLAAVLILQGAVTPTAAMKVDTVNTEDDVADMIEDFAREVMSESVFDMYVSRRTHSLHSPLSYASHAPFFSLLKKKAKHHIFPTCLLLLLLQKSKRVLQDKSTRRPTK
jgi:hypothetical protein